MDISLVIEQLRRYCPELGGRVGGAADFETGVESVIAITDPTDRQIRLSGGRGDPVGG